jgi:hypothetical protein
MRAQVGNLTGYLDEKSVGQLAGIRYKHTLAGRSLSRAKRMPASEA